MTVLCTTSVYTTRMKTMRIPDLEFMISDYEDPLCKHCNQSVDEHELVPLYRAGRFVKHGFLCVDHTNKSFVRMDSYYE